MADRQVHLCFGWGPWPREPFLDLVQAGCERRGLRFLLVRDDNVRQITRRVETGRLRILAHYNFEGDYERPDDPYARLGYAIRDAQGFVINEPDAARMAQHKAVMHYEFERAGIPLPHTVVVRNWEPADFRLTPAERKRLGRPFIIKPARGFGKQGVAKVQNGSVSAIARARRFDRGDDFLLQAFVEPAWLGGRRGWFRAYGILGEFTFCWWDNATEHYAPVTLAEFHEFDLTPLSTIARLAAACSHMNFFSTEVALARGPRRRFLAIDYINDPCDMTPQAHSHSGVPDVLVAHVAERIVESARRVALGLPPAEPCSLWFAD